MDNLLAARLQMAFTLGFHIVLACFGVGLPVLMLAAEGLFLKTRDELYRTLAQRWAKSFAVLFAIGAVSGTVLSFELGLLWPKFMGTFGSVISLPFTLEGFAFFLEAIFVGIYIYGWDKLTPRAHFLSGFPIAISGFLSAWFVVTANAWMNAPQGFDWVDGAVVNPDPITAMMNAATWAQTTHMILAAYIVSGFCVAGFYAWQLMPGRSAARNETMADHDTYHLRIRYNRTAMALGLALGCVCMPLQIAAGDWSAKVVAKTQPIKFAAMESHFKTEAGAGLLIGGWPDVESQTVRWGVRIPRLLSFLAHGELDAKVVGLEDFSTDEIPPVPVVHVAFQLMVGTGMLLMLFCFAVLVRLWRSRTKRSGLDPTTMRSAADSSERPLSDSAREFFRPKWFLWCTVWTGPLAIIAMESGWTVTEVGRQPWIVYGFMRTKSAVTEAEGIVWILLVTLGIYFVLGAGCLGVLRSLARRPFPLEAGQSPRSAEHQ